MKRRYRIAVTDPTFNPPEIEARLLGKNADVFVTKKWLMNESDLIKFAEGSDAILHSSFPSISRKTIEALSGLRIISLYSIGFDRVDLKAASESGVLVTNVPDYCVDEVADHTMMLILASLRKLLPLDRGIRKGEWGHNVPLTTKIDSIATKVLGLVAFGRIAKRVAIRAKPFGFRIVAYDPYLQRWDFSAFGVERAERLDELLKQADVVSLHTPLTPETEHMIGANELAKMKRAAVIVNTSRGAVIDKKALIRALAEKRIAGAAIDVFETEPIEMDDPLLRFDNVIVTPHIAGYSEEAFVRVRIEAAKAAADGLSGIRPQFLLNPEALK